MQSFLTLIGANIVMNLNKKDKQNNQSHNHFNKFA